MGSRRRTRSRAAAAVETGLEYAREVVNGRIESEVTIDGLLAESTSQSAATG